MEDNQKIEKLIAETKQIVASAENSRKNRGSDFNIFSILGVETKEIKICMFLYELLLPRGKHGAGSIYLKAFVENVLGLHGFSQTDFDNAIITKEELIDNDRRIDILIRIGKSAFPIEVKIYAEDQEKQCIDYYNYCSRKYNSYTVIYYLTLDKHMPSKSSIGQLSVAENLILISFDDEILNWLEEIISMPETQQRQAVKELINQFRDTLLKLTNRNIKDINMNLKSIINTPEEFRIAQVIANGVDSIKAEMMIKCFKYIEDYIEERSKGTIKPIHSDYVEKAYSFYNKQSSNWPALCYRLTKHDPSPTRDLIMRIEIQEHLYYGVTNWDDKEKKNPKGTDDDYVNNYVKSHAGDSWSWTKKKDDRWYFWKYLGVDGKGPNFRLCDETFAKLLVVDEFETEMKAACSEIERFLVNWGMLKG